MYFLGIFLYLLYIDCSVAFCQPSVKTWWWWWWCLFVCPQRCSI